MRPASIVLLAGLIAAPLAAARADGVYVAITGHAQGLFHGPSQYQGRLLGLAFSELTPVREHAAAPLPYRCSVTVDWGAALPQLQRAIATNEVLDVRLEFFTRSGERDQVYEVINLGQVGLQQLSLSFDPSATPSTQMVVSLIANQVTFGGAAGDAQPSRESARATPVLTLAQTRVLIRPPGSASDAPPVTQAWIDVTGRSSGKFPSEVRANGTEHTAMVESYSVSIVNPVDAAGHFSGHRLYQHTRIVKATGASSQEFHEAIMPTPTPMGYQPSITVAKLEFAPSGGRVAYRVTLTQGVVYGVQPSGGAEAIGLGALSIEMEYVITGGAYTDPWEATIN